MAANISANLGFIKFNGAGFAIIVLQFYTLIRKAVT